MSDGAQTASKLPPVVTGGILLQRKQARWGQLPSQPSEHCSRGLRSRGRASQLQPAPSCRRRWPGWCEPSAVPWRQLLQLYLKRCECTVTRAALRTLLGAVTVRSVCRPCSCVVMQQIPHDLRSQRSNKRCACMQDYSMPDAQLFRVLGRPRPDDDARRLLAQSSIAIAV